MKWNFFLSVLLACVIFVAAPGASANMLSIDYGDEFSGAQQPGGAQPILRAVFDDTLDAYGSNGVRLTLTTLNLTSTEYVLQWLFNFTGDASLLMFNVVNNTDAPPTATNAGNDAYPGDGGGAYDLQFAFTNASGADRFTNGEMIVYDIYTASTAIGADDFDDVSSNPPGEQNFLSAAQIGGILLDPNDDATAGICLAGNPEWTPEDGYDCGSGWIAGGYTPQSVVPVPPAVWLFGTGLLGLVGVARRKQAT
jgi:hypothetical protein